MQKRGLIIALYGINNLGKTTQREKLVERINRYGRCCSGYKYARYGISPSGPILDGYLRGGNPFGLTPREFQTIQVINRMQFQRVLEDRCGNGDVLVLEDYTWTGVAWGIGAGVDERYLRTLNRHLLSENLGVLLDGDRFRTGIEENHKHEVDSELTKRVREVHLALANELGWKIVAANRPLEEVAEEIWEIVLPHL